MTSIVFPIRYWKMCRLFQLMITSIMASPLTKMMERTSSPTTK